MTAFDRFAVVDWSGGNQRTVQPCKDAIWIGEAGQAPLYQRHRLMAEATLTTRIAAALGAGERLMIGFDFPFGYPRGFAKALTGQADPFAVWNWLAIRIEDAPKHNNRFDVAGQMNLTLGAGIGPFWGNPLRRNVAGLARNKHHYANPFPERRSCERTATGSFTCWQLAGAGAVGSQVLMGLPVLWRLRQRFAGQLSVWPFEPLNRPIAFVEVWPSLINSAVKAATGPADIRDAVQVRLLADAMARLDFNRLSHMLEVDAPEEGWIFGLGHEAELEAALC